MPTTVQPVLNTPDLERLLRFYADVFGARRTVRVPEEGPVFFQGLQIGDSDLGLVAAEDVEVGEPVRILLSIMVPDVDGARALVVPAGGRVLGPPNDMPWGQRVAHVSTRTATWST